MTRVIEREPVAAATIISIAGYLLAILLTVGVIGGDANTALMDAIRTLAPGAAVVLNLALTWLARARVTPLADPRMADGRPAVLLRE